MSGDTTNIFQHLFDKALARKDQAKLSETRKLEKISNVQLQNALKQLYDNNTLNHRLLAVVLNAITTQNKISFLFSERILNDLVQNDSNLKRATISGTDYKKFMIFTRNNNVLKILCPGKGIGNATVFEIIDPTTIELVLQQVDLSTISTQRENCIKVHTSHLTSRDSNEVIESNENTESNNNNAEQVIINEASPPNEGTASKEKKESPCPEESLNTSLPLKIRLINLKNRSLSEYHLDFVNNCIGILDSNKQLSVKQLEHLKVIECTPDVEKKMTTKQKLKLLPDEFNCGFLCESNLTVISISSGAENFKGLYLAIFNGDPVICLKNGFVAIERIILGSISETPLVLDTIDLNFKKISKWLKEDTIPPQLSFAEFVEALTTIKSVQFSDYRPAMKDPSFNKYSLKFSPEWQRLIFKIWPKS